jgi:two-component system response regulator NreC
MNYRYTLKIVIADDHQMFREGFKVLLRNQPELELIGEAENGRELLDVIEVQKPDLAFVDVKMPVMDGIEACRRLRTRFPDTQVIGLSSYNDDNLLVDMLESGAKGYLLKNTTREELLEAAMTVYEGGVFYSKSTSGKLARMIGKSEYNPYRKQPPVQFSKRELEIIRLMCQQLTNREIATRLSLSIRTVESHRDHIQEKTGAKNMVGMVIYAIKHGIYEI